MLGCVDKSDAMGMIRQEGGTRRFGFEHAFLGLGAKLTLVYAAVPGDKANHSFGTVNVKLFGDKDPFAFWIPSQQSLDMPNEVLFAAGVADGRGQELSGRHLHVGNQALGP